MPIVAHDLAGRSFEHVYTTIQGQTEKDDLVLCDFPCRSKGCKLANLKCHRDAEKPIGAELRLSLTPRDRCRRAHRGRFAWFAWRAGQAGPIWHDGKKFEPDGAVRTIRRTGLLLGGLLEEMTSCYKLPPYATGWAYCARVTISNQTKKTSQQPT